MTAFVVNNQLGLLVLCFLLGSSGAVLMYVRRATAYSWKVADLIWVILGGFGAVAAIVAGIYTADSSKLEGQIEVALAQTQEFEQDAARFRLSYCEHDWQGPAYRPHVLTLCEKVELLSASTAKSRRLPFFESVADGGQALNSLRLLPQLFGEKPDDLSKMMHQANSLVAEDLLIITARDASTGAAMRELSQTPEHVEISAQFLVLARNYERLIDQVSNLKSEWDTLQNAIAVLSFQIIALCLVAFAAPFRIGKTVVELL